MKQLHSAQDAIEQAIEGGWRENVWVKQYHPEIKSSCVDCIDNETGAVIERSQFEQVFTDPLFWQALGKARGWGYIHDCGTRIMDKHGDYWCDECKEDCGQGMHEWQYVSHQWFENRMVGGDETKYWESLP